MKLERDKGKKKREEEDRQTGRLTDKKGEKGTLADVFSFGQVSKLRFSASTVNYLPCQRGCPRALMLFVLCGSLLADRLSWANINFRWLLSHVRLIASMALRKQKTKRTKKER